MTLNLEQVANMLSQASYVLTCEGDNLDVKDLDIIISKVSSANAALHSLYEDKIWKVQSTST